MPAKVLYYSDSYVFGGSEHMLVLLLRAAARSDGFEPAFVYRYSRPYDTEARRRLPPEIPIRALRLPDPESLWSPLAGAPRRAVKLLGYATFARQIFQAYDVPRLAALFRRERPDVVHVNNGGFPAAASCNAAAVAARLAGVPAVVYVVNNLAVAYDSPLRWPEYPLDRLTARSVDRFVTGSEAAAGALRDVLQLSDRDVVALPNGVVPHAVRESRDEARRRHGVPEGAVVLLTAAQFDPRKGHAYLLEALSLLPAETRAKAFLLLVGDGPVRVDLEARTKALDLADRVRFVGHLDYESLWSLYHASDVVVLPSIAFEDFPYTVIEAMSAGRPVVGTRVAGIPEQVAHGATGEVVEPRDAAGLADALRRLIEQPALRNAYGAAAKDVFDRRFTAEPAVQRYFDLYRALLAERTAGA